MRWLALIVCIASVQIAHADDGDADKGADWGFGFKARRAWVTPYIQKLFLGDTPGTAKMDGIGFDFSRRRESSEFVFGFGYDRLEAQEGYYLDKGGTATTQGDVDYVTFNKPRWYTVEASIVNHARIHKVLEFRFGGGIGLGVVRGDVRKTDAVCTSASLQTSCMLDPMAVNVNKKANIPPVLPVVNALIGLQLRPTRFLHIHVDAGLHTVPYVTAGLSLYLW